MQTKWSEVNSKAKKDAESRKVDTTDRVFLRRHRQLVAAKPTYSILHEHRWLEGSQERQAYLQATRNINI